MIDRGYRLPLCKQVKALRLSRGALYYRPRPVSATSLGLMRRIDELHLEGSVRTQVTGQNSIL